MIVDLIEYTVFLIIVGIQISSFIKTRAKINEFKMSVPDLDNIVITDVEITDNQIDSFIDKGSFEEIENLKVDSSNLIRSEEESYDESYDEERYDDEPGEEEYDDETPAADQEIRKHKVRVVGCSRLDSKVFGKILSSLNKYLVRNKRSVADFTLIKDIVERNINTVEDEVHLTLSTPLYLGLMGTMLGIVIGLFSMSDMLNTTMTDKELSSAIGMLLGSVKVAMIASFIGLALTIYNSSIVFKGTKYNLEAKKNEFYTFIQVELLPSLNQGIGATLESLQRNLSGFNEKFDTNLDRLSTVFDKNYDSIVLQKKLLDQLDKNKVSEMTKYNLQVFKDLNVSLGQFEKFNELFANVNHYLNGTYRLTDKTNELLERTENFQTIANNISETVQSSTHLTDYLTKHFKDLDNHKQKVDEAIVNIGFGIKDTFDELKTNLESSSQRLNEEAINRNIASQKVFESFTEELKTSFSTQLETFNTVIEEKKSNLDYLKHLEPLLNEVKSHKTSKNSDQLYEQIVELTNIMSSSNQMLKHIEADVKTPLLRKLFQIK
ncbi:hypothetical protein HDF26_004563 [Pedobacter cryoconitis]|uniref:hypothetical protein n=1 Tax=Pedobacter cryoconitis TaxID=188932 RepID=UPI001621AB0E|nr:hypothetical protein [Pedobacter cryoconitis]MBB6274090.1 hypothetical protein [Pedobacter cryoconitis]